MSMVSFKPRTETSLPGDGENWEVQITYVSRVMTNTIEKLKIAACLPALLCKNAFRLRKFFCNDEIEFIQSTCAKHNSSNSRTKATQEKHPRMALVLDMIWNNKKLRNLALGNHTTMADQAALNFIDSVQSLRQIVEIKMRQTAKETRSRESYLKTAWYENEEMRLKLKALTGKIERQRHEYETKIAQSNELILSHQSKVRSQLQNFKQSMRDRVEDSERRMLTFSGTSLLRQSDLSNEGKTVTSQYDAVLSEHLNVEKKLRAKRLKFETQLGSWLNKFDADMGEKQAEFETVEAGYNDQQERMDMLKFSLKELQAEYERLWNEKLEEALAWFRVNRAARIIQRFWRKHRRPKSGKKKNKKKKKKKK